MRSTTATINKLVNKDSEEKFQRELEKAQSYSDSIYPVLCVLVNFQKFDQANELLKSCSTYTLDCAIRTHNLDMVKYIVENSTALDEKYTLASPPLINAIYTLDLDILDYLIEKKVDVNKRTLDGLTPLHVAARLLERDKEKDATLIGSVIKRLLDAGADPGKTHMGQTPLDKTYFLLKDSFSKDKKDEENRRLKLLDDLFPAKPSAERQVDETDTYKPYRPSDSRIYAPKYFMQ